MRTSQYLISTLKEDPKEAAVESHRLMLRAGMIRQFPAFPDPKTRTQSVFHLPTDPTLFLLILRYR